MACPLFDPLAWRMAYFFYPSCFLACPIFLLVVIVKSASRVGVPAAVRSRGGCPSSDSTPPVCVSGRYIRLSGGMTPLFSLEQSVKLRLGLCQAGRVVSFYCRPFCLLLLRPPLKRRDRRHLLLEIRLDCLVGREKGDQLPLLHSHLRGANRDDPSGAAHSHNRVCFASTIAFAFACFIAVSIVSLSAWSRLVACTFRSWR